MLNIRTDHIPRTLLTWHELPEAMQKEFDYITPDQQDSPRFVKYKGQYYDAIDTQRIVVERTNASRMGWEMYVTPEEPLAAWHAIASDSFFSGMVFRFDEDFEKVVVGVYTS